MSSTTSCILCQSLVHIEKNSLKAHYLQCSAKNKASCNILLARMIINESSICFKCGNSFNSVQWIAHSKNCSKKKKSIVYYDAADSASRHLLSLTTGYTVGTNQSFSRNLANIAYQYTLANVPLWLNLNKTSSTKSLTNFFMNRLGISMGQVLTAQVPSISQNQIKALHIKALKNVKPEELFNSHFVDNLISTMSPHNHLKFVTFLNKKAKATGSFEIRPIPKVRRQRNPFKPAKFFPLMKFLASFIYSGKKKITHLGLDLLLIFQTGVRFLADGKLLQKQIAQNKPVIYLDINKTSKEARIVLPDQTRQLIRKLNWERWHPKTIKLYKYMKEWAGMRGYTLKYTILSYLHLISTPQKQDVSQTGHAGFFSILPYLDVVKGEITREQLQNTQIPGILNSQNSWENISKINNFFFGLDQVYQQINPNFMKNLISNFYKNEQEYLNDEEYRIVSAPQTDSFSKAKHKQLKLQLSQEICEQEIANQDEESQSSKECQILINGIQMRSNFQSNTYFLQQGLKKCIFCMNQYEPPLCSCLNSRKGICLKSIPGRGALSMNIQIPSQYFNQQYDPEFLNIRRLIALRKFKYVTHSSCMQEYKTDNSLKNVWENSDFQRLERECYFPPLKLKKSGEKMVSYEDSFGLFAKKNIMSNILIGQFAANFTSWEYYQCARRLDIFVSIRGNQQRIIITPVINMGYACLINHAKGDKANCAYKLVEVCCETKIIIYTKKQIKKDEQLLCQFEQDFKQVLLNIHQEQFQFQKINECFADVLYELYNQVYKKIPDTLINRRNIVDTFLSQNKQIKFSQQDFIDFFVFTEEIIDSKFKFMMEIKCKCDNCSTQTMNTVPQYFYIVDKKDKVSFRYSQSSGDFNCSTCNQKSTALITGEIKQENQFIGFAYQRWNAKGFMDHFVHCPSILSIRTSQYRLVAGILFLGQDKNGHYILKKTIQNDDRRQIYFAIYKSFTKQVEDQHFFEQKLDQKHQVEEQRQLKGQMQEQLDQEQIMENQAVAEHQLDSKKINFEKLEQNPKKQQAQEVEKKEVYRMKKVQNDDSGRYFSYAIYSKQKSIVFNQYFPCEIASIVKLFVFLYCQRMINQGIIRLDDQIKMPNFNWEENFTTCGIKCGQQCSLEGLLYGMLISSSCQAAYCICHYIAIRKNIQIMQILEELNDVAKQLKIENTKIKDFTGLGNSTSTVSDIRVVLKNLRSSKLFMKIIQCQTYKLKLSERTIQIKTTNEIFGDKIFGKTGNGRNALFCFAGFTQEKNHTYDIIVLGGKDSNIRFDQCKKLLFQIKKMKSAERINKKQDDQRQEN